MDQRIVDMQTSLNMIATSVQSQDQRVKDLSDTLKGHIQHEEKMFEKLDEEHDKTKEEINDLKIDMANQKMVSKMAARLASIITGSAIVMFMAYIFGKD